MKLISLYIDNFGKFSDFSLDFSKQMNSIYEENGWGKTTLTVFIKSMLYGLSKTERVQYTPWKNLSSFGGCLVLESNGREYRIERQFSPHKASADTFKVFDLQSNTQIDHFSPNIGEALLNLNEHSFERSVFIPQKDLEDGFGSDIEAKLANLIGGTDDSQSFEEAIEILKDKTHELKLNSKKGLIIDKQMQLAQIEDEIQECNTRMEGVPTLQKTIESVSQEIAALTEEKRKNSNRILTFTKSQDKRAKLEVVHKYEEDIHYTELLLEKNNEVFNGHNVSAEEVLSYRAKNKELQTLRTEYQVKKENTRASEKVERLEKEVNLSDLPDDETLEHITEQILKYNNIKSVITAHKQEPKEKIKPKAGITLTIIASILLFVGLALFVVGYFLKLSGKGEFGFIIAGIAVAILSILSYIGALASFIVVNQKNAALQVGGQVAAYDYEKIHLEEEIREFFGKYHVYSSDFTNNMFKIRANVQRYKDAKAEAFDIQKENQVLSDKIKEYENSIALFLGQFKSSESCTTNEEKIGELNTHLRKRGEIEAELAQKQALLKDFITDNGLDMIDSQSFNVEELNRKAEELDQKIETLTSSRTTYQNKMAEYEKEIAMYDDYIAAKDTVEKEIRQMEEEYRLLNLSIDYLSMSQNSLLEKYVRPMKDSVNKYVSLLLKDSSDYNIDVNFKFQFVTNTGLKGIDSYSRGYQTIIQLCMRLALIDCLYPHEKPFIILDDPFVNFDDEKLELCKALIRTISSNYQIMYFTCHKSREISSTVESTYKAPAKPAEAPKAAPVKPATKVVEEAPKVAPIKPAEAPKPAPIKPAEKPVEEAPKAAPVKPASKLAAGVGKEPAKPTIKVAKSGATTQTTPVVKRTATKDGALGPMMSRGTASTSTTSTGRTIKITKK